MLHKTFDILETKTDPEAGTFEATVAIFGNIDRGGDRILPGAFQKTLDKWRESGDPIPIILSHQWNDPMAHIGIADPSDVTETENGLHVKGRLDIGDNDVARQVHRLMLRRSLKEFSFGYDVPKGGQRRAKDGANELREVDLAEIGPTLKGMNPATELHAVKTALETEAQEQQKELRDESDRLERQVVETKIPDDLDPPPAVEPPDPTVELRDELAQVKAQVVELSEMLAIMRKNAEEADKDPEGRSVDPLRKRSEELALEVVSDGMSLRKPPAQAIKPEEPVDVDALRRQSRDLMLQILSITTE